MKVSVIGDSDKYFSDLFDNILDAKRESASRKLKFFNKDFSIFCFAFGAVLGILFSLIFLVVNNIEGLEILGIVTLFILICFMILNTAAFFVDKDILESTRKNYDRAKGYSYKDYCEGLLKWTSGVLFDDNDLKLKKYYKVYKNFEKLLNAKEIVSISNKSDSSNKFKVVYLNEEGITDTLNLTIKDCNINGSSLTLDLEDECSISLV